MRSLGRCRDELNGFDPEPRPDALSEDGGPGWAPVPWRSSTDGTPICLVDARTVAGILAVRPEWVRAHAQELGGVRLGTGPKAPWRFDLANAMTRLQVGQRSPPNGVRERQHAVIPPTTRAPRGSRVSLFESEDGNE